MRKKGKEESKDGDPPYVISQENEQAEQALMLNEEVLAAEFRSDCAAEWNRRRLAQEYASVDGEGFGRDGIYRIDRFGCMEMYVGEFDEEPPSVPSATELWELYMGGGGVPENILKKERLDKELMRIGRHEHLKQCDETKRELDFAPGGPTLRMMFVGKKSKNTKKKNKKEIFFSKGGGGGDETPKVPNTSGDSPEEEGQEESKCEEFDEEESPKELEIASQNLRLREQWLKKEMSTVGADPKHEKVLDEINQVTLEVAKIESRLVDMGKGSRKRSDSSEESESASEGDAQRRDPRGRRGWPSGLVRGHLDEECREGGTGVETPPSKRR